MVSEFYEEYMEFASILLLETCLNKFLDFTYVLSFDFVDRFRAPLKFHFFLSNNGTLGGQNPMDPSIIPSDVTHPCSALWI